METQPTIDVQVDSGSYHHWRVEIDGPVATVTMDVDPTAGLRPGDYELKTNSYDLSVDIELYDITQRLRFEHPTVTTVVLTGGLDKVFCAGANIQMLASSSHAHKVNFCKFTNETRNYIETAGSESGQTWIAAVNGTAAGGGYELALACDEILLIDDRASAVSLPEIPLLAVLPGTGGLTRVVDKRMVRRDRADIFATKTEGVRGQQALDWGLVDAIAPASEFPGLISDRVAYHHQRSHRPAEATGVELKPLTRTSTGDRIDYRSVSVEIDRTTRSAQLTVTGPDTATTPTPDELVEAGSDSWLLNTARELDDAILHLRFNEPLIGTIIIKTRGSSANVKANSAALDPANDHWLITELRLYWGRVLSRLDLTSRSIFAFIEPESCFSAILAELAFAADRSYMLDGTWYQSDTPAPTIELTEANVDWFPMVNGISRLATRFWGRQELLDNARQLIGKDLDATAAVEAELVTMGLDDLDYEDEVRITVEERASFSPDALIGMEANYRFVGPETLHTKIFARLTAWQNWIFQRPNAVGPEGALRRFGTGSRPEYNLERV